MQGSAVTGKKYTTGEPFDVGRKSDFDVALASPQLLNAAKAAGVKLRSGGTRSGPLTKSELARLGLTSLAEQMSKDAGRKVAFMIYGSPREAMLRSGGVVIP